MKRTTIRCRRIIREPYEATELPFTLDWFDSAGNLIAELGRYADLASARAQPFVKPCDTGPSAACVCAIAPR